MPQTSRNPLACPSSSPFTAMLMFAIASGIAVTNAGCGQTVCIQWSEKERISPTQICPSHEQALTLFGKCTDVVAVDDEGSYANDLCCYAVTKDGPTPSERGCVSVSTGPSTKPGSGAFAVGTGFAVSTGFSASSGGQACDNELTCGDTGTGCIGCALNGPCRGELDNCTSSKACVSFLDCLGACSEGDGACADACGAKEPMGLKLYTAMIACSVCMQCPNACFAMAAKSCSGLSGSSVSTSGGGGAGGMGGG
jgi:hypothetical protein